MHRLAAGEDETSELEVNGCFEHMGHAENVDASGKSGVLIDERAHHVGQMNCVRDVGMLVKHIHDVAEIADVHRNRIKAGSSALGKTCKNGESPLIRGLIGRDDGNLSGE